MIFDWRFSIADCRLPIADCRFNGAGNGSSTIGYLKSPITNQHPRITNRQSPNGNHEPAIGIWHLAFGDHQSKIPNPSLLFNWLSLLLPESVSTQQRCCVIDS
ncbi:MAG TPA: hypothetical protein VK893_10120, partial [Pyrinomonadaceae bacterium]|nr:hypothetical protein [Pyrinomonadaceae bacterium]